MLVMAKNEPSPADQTPKDQSQGTPGQPGWQPALGVKLLRTLEGHKNVVTSVAFDPQGGTLASGCYDNTVKLWEACSGRLLRTLEGRKNSVYSVAFDPQGGTLASGSAGSVSMWEADSGK